MGGQSEICMLTVLTILYVSNKYSQSSRTEQTNEERRVLDDSGSYFFVRARFNRREWQIHGGWTYGRTFKARKENVVDGRTEECQESWESVFVRLGCLYIFLRVLDMDTQTNTHTHGITHIDLKPFIHVFFVFWMAWVLPMPWNFLWSLLGGLSCKTSIRLDCLLTSILLKS